MVRWSCCIINQKRERDLGKMKRIRAHFIAAGFSLFLLLVIAAVMPTTAQAAPTIGEVFNLKQPDGTYVDVRVYGDEF